MVNKQDSKQELFVDFLKEFNPSKKDPKENKSGLARLESKEALDELDFQKTAYLSDN